MRKFIPFPLIAILISVIFGGCGSSESNNYQAKDQLEHEDCFEDIKLVLDPKFREFLDAIIPTAQSFEDHFKDFQAHQEKVLGLLAEKGELSQELKTTSLENIENVKNDLKNLKQAAKKFKNSQKISIQHAAKECLDFQASVNTIMDRYSNFIANPRKSTPSNQKISNFKKETADIEEYFTGLITLIRVARSTELSEVGTQSRNGRFQLSEQESEAIAALAGEPTDVLQSEAMRGNAAAFYWLGHHVLSGPNGALNIEQAKQYYAASAMLGYVPAMYKLGLIYYKNDENYCLAAVYSALAALFGNLEMAQSTNMLRKELNACGCQAKMDAIERVAEHKRLKIHETAAKLKNVKDKTEIISSILSGENSLIAEDLGLGYDEYWKNF